MLLDFLPAAWTLTKHLKSSNMYLVNLDVLLSVLLVFIRQIRSPPRKLVTHIPLQKAIIAYLGIPEAMQTEHKEDRRCYKCVPTTRLLLFAFGLLEEVGGSVTSWHFLYFSGPGGSVWEFKGCKHAVT